MAVLESVTLRFYSQLVQQADVLIMLKYLAFEIIATFMTSNQTFVGCISTNAFELIACIVTHKACNTYN